MTRIAISQRVVENEAYPERRDALDQRWCALLEAAAPGSVLLPIPNGLRSTAGWLEALAPDALILSGGNDWGDAEERDRAETEAFGHFRARGLPVLGVCRGFQVINLLLGGKLLESVAGYGDHVACTHAVTLAGGPLRELAGADTLTVNSFHDQGVLLDGVGEGLVPFAVGADGVVEGVHHATEPILGVQWHPERDDPAARFDAALLRRFLEHGAFWAREGGA
jgi:putative glutamine amidotransferase